MEAAGIGTGMCRVTWKFPSVNFVGGFVDIFGTRFFHQKKTPFSPPGLNQALARHLGGGGLS